MYAFNYNMYVCTYVLLCICTIATMYILGIYTVFVQIEARASICFQRVLTRPLFEPGFYLSPSDY